MTPFLIKNSVDDFYSPTLFIIEPEMFLGFPSSENNEDYSILKNNIADVKNKKDIAEMLISFVLYRMSQNVEKYANDNGMSIEDYLQNIIDTEQ